MGRTHATQTRAKTPPCQYAVGPADTFNRTLTTMGKPINSTTATQCFACGWIFIDGSFLVEPEAVLGESRIYTFASSFQVWSDLPGHVHVGAHDWRHMLTFRGNSGSVFFTSFTSHE